MVSLQTICALMAAGPAAPALIVFGDSYTDAGYAGYGIHQVIHAALSTPELDVGEQLNWPSQINVGAG